MGLRNWPLPTEIYLSESGSWSDAFGIHSSLGHAKTTVSNKTYRHGPGKIYHLVDNDWVLMYDVPKIEHPGGFYGHPSIDWEAYRV